MRQMLFFSLFLSLLFSAGEASAAIYKWVDENGSVHFTDTPPPDEIKSMVVNPEPNQFEGNGKIPERKPGLADELATAPRKKSSGNYPVVEMFVTSWCGYCKKAEAWFSKRNIPFVKYDIEKDQRAAKRKASLTNSRGVPFVLIGEVGIPGYSEAAFERALNQQK